MPRNDAMTKTRETKGRIVNNRFFRLALTGWALAGALAVSPSMAQAYAQGPPPPAPGTLGATNPEILGTWRCDMAIDGLEADIVETIEPNSVTIVAKCSYPAFMPVYSTTTRLTVAAQIGSHSLWEGAGHASTSSGSLNCPLDSAGGIGEFRVEGDRMYSLDATGAIARASNGEQVVFQRVRTPTDRSRLP
jgi:hypothetical protein